MTCKRQRQYKGYTVTHVGELELQVADEHLKISVTAHPGTRMIYECAGFTYPTIHNAMDHAIGELSRWSVPHGAPTPGEIRRALEEFMGLHKP